MFNKLKVYAIFCMLFTVILTAAPEKAYAERTQIQASAVMVQAAAIGEEYIKPILAKVKLFKAKNRLKKQLKNMGVSYRHEDGIQVDCNVKTCAFVIE